MKERKKRQNGITLIALVISIIVMLILAGVSLNLTIGDNGIIKQAQNATIQNSIAALQEFLQQQYVKNYDKMRDEETRITNMQLIYPEYFYIPKNERIGGLNYIVNSDGNALYLIKKSGLPKEIRDILVGGDAGNGTYFDYATLNDVYGVTSELKVYYCENGKASILGLDSGKLDSDNPLRTVFDSNKNPEIYNYLSNLGITGTDGKITANDLKNVNDLTIDSTSGITSFKDFYNFTSLKKLTIKNVTLTDLSGIENISGLEYLFFSKSVISDYSAISGVKGLKYLYMQYITDDELTKICTAMENINYPYLEYLGVFGYNMISFYNYAAGPTQISQGCSEVTTISPLSKFSDSTKKNIKYLYINNNKLSDIKVLKDFSNITFLEIRDNANLVSFEGLENHSSLTTIYALNVGVTSTINLKGATGLKYFNGRYSKISDVSGFANSSLIENLLLEKCKLTSFSGLENCSALTELRAENNSTLINVAQIKGLSNITNLFLAGCENMAVDDVIELEDIILGCGSNYSLPSKYSVCFSNTPRIDYSNLDLTNDDINFKALKGKTSCEALNLTGNSQLGNSELQTILSSLTSMKYLCLNGCTNLSTINFVDNMPELVELDIRGTAVTDLSKLENITTIRQLIIDNEDSVMTNIPKTISRCSGTSEGWFYIGNNKPTNPGLYLGGKDKLLTSISGITSSDFTYLKMFYASGFTNGILNLSNCSGLKKIHLNFASGFSFSLPNSIELIDCIHISDVDVLSSFGNCANLTSLTCYVCGGAFISKAFSLCSGAPLLTTVDCKDSSLGDFPANVNLPACTTMTFQCWEGSANRNVTSLTNLATATLPNLKTLSLNYNRNLTSLNGIQYLPALESLECYNCRLSDISNLASCTNLKKFDISNVSTQTLRNAVTDISCLENLNKLEEFYAIGNKISDLRSLRNKTKLTKLNLKDNCIYDNSVYEVTNDNGENTTITYNNIQLLARLNPNYSLSNAEIAEGYSKGSLQYLYLSGNTGIADFSSVANLRWTDKSGF